MTREKGSFLGPDAKSRSAASRDRESIALVPTAPNINHAGTIQDFYAKRRFKYKNYGESTEFLRNRGYESYLQIAEKWKAPYGKLPDDA